MREYFVDFFDFCDGDIKNSISSFCDNINNSKADVFIIMAHKAVLFFNLLLEQGYIHKNIKEKIIITNLALDFDCDYLLDKHIAILDDIVISGTSIAATINKLLSVGISKDNIEIISISVDKHYFAMNFNNNKSVLHCNYIMDDASCIELSAIISKAFSYYGFPCDVDFPIYEEFTITQQQLNVLHNNVFWETVDISNSNQISNGIMAYTLFPKTAVRKQLWNKLGIELENCVDLKIRLYIIHYPDGTLKSFIVPMCLFNEISLDKLSIIFKHINSLCETSISNFDITDTAKMRYLEYIIAHQFNIIFCKFSLFCKKIKLNTNMVYQLFGLTDGKTVIKQLESLHFNQNKSLINIEYTPINNSEIFNNFKNSNVYNKNYSESRNLENSNEYEQGCWINSFIYSCFLWWYDEKEITIRRTIKKNKYHYINDFEEIKKCLFRLKNGLPISVLKEILKDIIPELSNQELEKLIYSFVDRAVDEGIIVPTIYFDEKSGYLCRAYRHGEDLPFGKADQYRLVYFLNTFGKYISINKENKLSEITLEKIIVLFYQIGLKSGNIFNRFLGFDNVNIIHSFLCVHGVIEGFTEAKRIPHIYSEQDENGKYITWLTSWLKNNLFIRYKKIDNYYNVKDSDFESVNYCLNFNKIADYLEKEDRSSISDTVKQKIDSIAELIAIWYNDINSKKSFKKDIIALTSCTNRYVFASAIATENHYFYKYWKNQAMYALSETSDIDLMLDRLEDSEENQNYKKIIIQSLYSGIEKIEWFNNGKAKEVVNSVKNLMSPTNASVWLQFWKDLEHVKIQVINDKFDENIIKAELILYLYNIFFECLISYSFWECGALTDEKYIKYKSKINNIFDCFPDLDNQYVLIFSEIFDFLENINSIMSLDKRISKFIEYVYTIISISNKNIGDIEKGVKKMDPTYTIRYTAALIVDIEYIDKTNAIDPFIRLWENFEENEIKTELNFVCFPEETYSDAYKIKFGIFYNVNKKKVLDTSLSYNSNASINNLKFLYNIFNNMCYLLNSRIYSIRGMILPDIKPGFNFEHNLKQNIHINSIEFYNSTVKNIEKYYTDGVPMQLLFALNHLVNVNNINDLIPNNRNWIIKSTNCRIENLEWVSNLVACKYNNTCSNSNSDQDNLESRVIYSMVNIICGRDKSLGILMNTKKRIVCVACNHTFKEYSNKKTAIATSFFNKNLSFELHPLKEIKSYHSEIISSVDEIMLLEPCWKGDIPFDISNLISIDDWDDINTGYQNIKSYICNQSNDYEWVQKECFKALGPIIDGGYYQIEGEECDIKQGCSGAVYIGNNNENTKLLGIHEGRLAGNTGMRIIKWSAILKAINSIE